MEFLKFKIRDNKNEKRVETIDSIQYTDNSFTLKDPAYVAITYTGLADSKHNEVYYGDVLLCNGKYYIVKYDDAGAFDGEYSLYFFELFGFEVVGNVFENPEFVSKTDEQMRDE